MNVDTGLLEYVLDKAGNWNTSMHIQSDRQLLDDLLVELTQFYDNMHECANEYVELLALLEEYIHVAHNYRPVFTENFVLEVQMEVCYGLEGFSTPFWI